VRSVTVSTDESPFVYDLSVPGCENFVAGEGPVACHNSRGQQGIGISAAGLYAQLTTGKPMLITSRTGKGKPAHRISVLIDTAKNQPKVLEDTEVEWDREHGTRVELELVGAHRGGRTGIDTYIEQTIVANPHVTLAYKPPDGEMQLFPRATENLPREPLEIKPHPHGVELGMLMRMLHDARGLKVKGALQDSFSRVSAATAQAVCDKAGVPGSATATSLSGEDIEKLHKALGETKVMAPPSTAVVPIGEDLIVAGLQRRYKAEIFEATTRPPSVYRGNPFVVECGIAYGGELPLEESAEIMRFANRVPLQYQPGACAITEAVHDTNWKNYTLSQPKGSLPIAPMAIFVHLASVWVPFTSEAKEAVAHYDDILREIRFSLQECGRKLAAKLRARDRAESEARRRSIFERYIPELGVAIGTITGRSPSSVEKLFFSALPNFVKNLEAGPPTEGGAPDGSSTPPPSPSEPPPADEAPARGKRGKKAAPKAKRPRGKK
jgi:DNA topoisomerase VI subunit B